MQDMKKKQQCNEESKKKERHIVTWTQEVNLFSIFIVFHFYFNIALFTYESIAFEHCLILVIWISGGWYTQRADWYPWNWKVLTTISNFFFWITHYCFFSSLICDTKRGFFNCKKLYAVGQLLHLNSRTRRQDSAEEGEVFELLVCFWILIFTHSRDTIWSFVLTFSSVRYSYLLLYCYYQSDA